MKVKSVIPVVIAILALVVLALILKRQSEVMDQNAIIVSSIEKVLERLESENSEVRPNPTVNGKRTDGSMESSPASIDDLADRLWKKLQSSCLEDKAGEGTEETDSDETKVELTKDKVLAVQEMGDFVDQILKEGDLKMNDVMELRRLSDQVGIGGKEQIISLRRKITDAINRGELTVEDPAFILF